MTHHDAFLADILEHPDDDTPRLIYADWLEDNGEPPRAEFIRVQVELANIPPEPTPRGPQTANNALATIPDSWSQWKEAFQFRLRQLRWRERELLDAHGLLWVEQTLGQPRGLSWGPDRLYHTFRRGFVESITLDAASWLTHADALTAAAPIREVRLTERLGQDACAELLARARRKMGVEWLDQFVELPALQTLLSSLWSRITFHLPEPLAV